MTRGERFVEAIPRKTRFYDRNERRGYELTRAVAACLIDDPALVNDGIAYLNRHMSRDVSQSQYVALWDKLLRSGVEDIVPRLLEDSPRGALLRDTQPVFCVLPPEVRREIIARARSGAVAATV